MGIIKTRRQNRDNNDPLFTSRIEKVRFVVRGSDEIRASSRITVNSYELMRNNLPYPGGVYDGHLGTTDHGYTCQTCFNRKELCLGHTGCLVLNYPVFSPVFINEIRKWLKLICFTCGHPIIPQTDFMQFPPAKRLDEASKIARSVVRKCANCGVSHPIIKRDKKRILEISAEFFEDREQKKSIRSEKLLPHTVRNIFNRISDVHVIALGKSLEAHPRKFILDVISIPPTTIRPDVKKQSGGRSANDDLTTLIQLIVKRNAAISPINQDHTDPKLVAAIYALNAAVYDFIRGPTPGETKSIGKGSYLRSLADRLRGKRGRFRRTILGKRVRLSARSTIINNPMLKVNELGIPMYFAKTLQVEEVVQEYNIDRLNTYFLNGRSKYPGSTKVLKAKTGAEHSVENVRPDFVLEIGDTLCRDLIDGDFVLFNRQPTLHPSSIGAHRVIVIRDENMYAIMMNVIACKWYQADFDGDQMNIHVLAPAQCRNEIRQQSGVENWVTNTSSSLPYVGEVDDSIVGSFEMTRDDVRFDKYHCMMLFNNCNELPSFTPDELARVLNNDNNGTERLFTGYDVISIMLRNTPINYDRPGTVSNSAILPYMKTNPRELRTIIENGVHKQGVLDKKAIGSGSEGGLFHIINSEYGPSKTLEIMHDLQQLSIAYMFMHGFSMGIHDIMVSPESLSKIHEIESIIIQDANLVTKRLESGDIIPPIDSTLEHFYEQQIISKSMPLDDFAEPVIGGINIDTNNLFKLMWCGSKGSMGNIYHICSAIGQILINGERARMTFSYKRSHPMFQRFDMSPEARGYIANSYITGMSPTEFTFNAMNARFDNITRVLTTSVAGDMGRKGIKNLETCIVNNLYACIKGDNIIQFIYGEDGYDCRFVEKVKFPTLFASDADLESKFHYKSNNNTLQSIFDAEYARIIEDRSRCREVFMRIEDINMKELMSDMLMSPVNIERLMRNVSKKLATTNTMPTLIDDNELADMTKSVQKFCTSSVPYFLLNTIQEARGSTIPPHILKSTYLLCVNIRSHLCATRLRTAGIRMPQLQHIMDVIRYKVAISLVDYGAAVGVLAAQSFSAPFTQYLISAHHHTAEGGTSHGKVNRIKEVFAVRDTDRMFAPKMLVMPTEDIITDREKVQELAYAIEMMSMRQFVIYYQIFFEKYGEPIHPTYIGEKTSMFAEFKKYNPLITVPGDLINWCIRLKLNKTTLILKNITVEHIINKVREEYPHMFFVYTPENSPEIIIRVYMRRTLFKSNQYIDTDLIRAYVEKFLDTVVRGISGVTSTTVVKLMRHKIDQNGAIVRVDDRYGITTVGTNLRGVFTMRGVSKVNTMSDSLVEIVETFGIEAVRASIFTEIKNLQDTSINKRHLSIFADEMTFTGTLTSIERSGLSTRESTNVLLRMGFASPIQTLEEAGINTMEDHVQGITSPVLLGTTPLIGTNYNSFHIATDIIRDNVKTAVDVLDVL